MKIWEWGRDCIYLPELIDEFCYQGNIITITDRIIIVLSGELELKGRNYKY